MKNQKLTKAQPRYPRMQKVSPKYAGTRPNPIIGNIAKSASPKTSKGLERRLTRIK